MIGSLNTMSYLEPLKWWKKPLAWFKRSQETSIQEQYEKYNVRAFDLHIYFIGDHDMAIIKYGNIEYKTFSIYEILNYLNNKGDCYVRVVLEETSLSGEKDKINGRESRFFDYCSKIEIIYPQIKFFGGYRECDSYKIYKFKNESPYNLIFHKFVNKLGK